MCMVTWQKYYGKTVVFKLGHITLLIFNIKVYQLINVNVSNDSIDDARADRFVLQQFVCSWTVYVCVFTCNIWYVSGVYECEICLLPCATTYCFKLAVPFIFVEINAISVFIFKLTLRTLNTFCLPACVQ